jgi:hypothetical protein
MACKVKHCSESFWFYKGNVDSFLFVWQNSDEKLVELVYVDYLMITRNNRDSIAKLKKDL